MKFAKVKIFKIKVKSWLQSKTKIKHKDLEPYILKSLKIGLQHKLTSIIRNQNLIIQRATKWLLTRINKFKT